MRVTDLFDQYLNNTLSETDRLAFEREIEADEVFAKSFNEHRLLVEALEKHSKRSDLKRSLQQIHQKEFGTAKVISLQKESFASKHGRTMAVAASTAFFAVLSTVAILSA